MAGDTTTGSKPAIDVAAAALDYVRGTAKLQGTARIARYTVDHVRAVTGAEWAELATTNRAGLVDVLATADPAVTDVLMRVRIETASPSPPDATLSARTVVVNELASDSPWADFGPAAAQQTPVRSAVLPYFAIADGLAAVLPVYDRRPAYFSVDQQRYIRLVADLAALALAGSVAVEQARHLAAALQSRGTIGTAVGVLMAMRRIDADAAFELLRRTSQHRNRKLADLARDVVDTGSLG